MDTEPATLFGRHNNSSISVMKKTTKTKALTPAKKTAAKPVVKKSAAAPAAKKAKTVAKKPAAPKVSITTITAQIDVGFGNALFLRGEGPGLNLEKGLLLNCVADTEWSVNLSGAKSPLTFKFLLNDETWCVGEDYTLAPGKVGTFAPEF